MLFVRTSMYHYHLRHSFSNYSHIMTRNIYIAFLASNHTLPSHFLFSPSDDLGWSFSRYSHSHTPTTSVFSLNFCAVLFMLFDSCSRLWPPPIPVSFSFTFPYL
ncbi:hypothetical protein H2248_008467 [Termitomyces sp. 'cryptogamus']|nr:hypothetical protein H2248_008467 [Termitomyces sp. 'cryptogamus']